MQTEIRDMGISPGGISAESTGGTPAAIVMQMRLNREIGRQENSELFRDFSIAVLWVPAIVSLHDEPAFREQKDATHTLV